MNPASELLRLLRPKAAVWGAIHGSGSWSISFRERGDLLFFRVDLGACQLLRAGAAPLLLGSADCLMVRTCVPFTLASNPEVAPVDSWELVAKTRSTEMRVGGEGGVPSVIRGGRMVFQASDDDPLMHLLPPLVHVAHGGVSSERVRALLGMLEAEASTPRLWSETVHARLLDLLLLELLRGEDATARPSAAGLLAGLGDPIVARALAAMHGDIARAWTVAELARLAGRSRSSFSQRFRTVVGMAPLIYLQRWRFAVAKKELRGGRRSVSEVARIVGFQSGGGFSTAFARAVGCSPTAYAAADGEADRDDR